MRRIVPKTFFGQLVLGTMLAQTFFLFLFIWYTVVSQKNGADERTRQRIIQQLDRLEPACARELGRGDMPTLHEVLELSRIAPSLQVARVTDLAGKTIAMTDGVDDGLDTYEQAILSGAPRQQIFKISNGQLEAVTPVSLAGKTVALLWLEPNHAVSLTTANTVVRVALAYGGFALLVNLLPIFLIVRTMTQPLHTLREATQRVVLNPDLNAGFPLPVTSSNEAGELTKSFNAMVLELEEQRSGLLETLALLDSMLGNAPIGFAFFDRELQYVRLNEFLADMDGLTIEQHLGKRPTELHPGSMSKEAEVYLKRVFETGVSVRDVELSGAVPDAVGTHRSWLAHFYPVRTHDTIRRVGMVAVEITERLQAEEALRKTEKLAAAGRLAASIAHEINNPLEAVTNLLYLLGTAEKLDESAAQLVNTAQAELARVAEITQQTLRFYRQSSSPKRTNLVELLDSIVKLYQTRMNASHVTVMKKFRGAADVFGFSGELRQLFANLIGNAVDAMAAGGCLFLRVRRGHGCGLDGIWCDGVRISVTDTGTGMSQETLRHVFEAFFTTKEATGTGLGLWVSEEIIRKHFGTVHVRTRQGAKSGTSFMLFFPDDCLGGEQKILQAGTSPV